MAMIFRHKIIRTALYFSAAIFVSQFNYCATTKKGSGTPITKIAYSSSGGRSGNYENLEISPDSLFYVQARRGIEKAIRQKTATTFWNDLTGRLHLEDFDRIRSDPGHALYDGIDITINVQTASQKHTIVNGSEDTINYNKIRPFTERLENRLEQLRKEITW
jgi:hypothetical protein